jgi:hypothetical protein
LDQSGDPERVLDSRQTPAGCLSPRIANHGDKESVGGRYTPLKLGERSFDFVASNSANSKGKVEVQIALYDAELFTASFRLILRQARQTVVDLTPPLQTLKFIPKDNAAGDRVGGTFEGTLRIPGESISRRFSGIVARSHNGFENRGYGLVEGPASQPWKTGRITMAPTAAQQPVAPVTSPTAFP